MADAYLCRLLPLTCLAPEIVEAIVDGRQPKGLRLLEKLGSFSGTAGHTDINPLAPCGQAGYRAVSRACACQAI